MRAPKFQSRLEKCGRLEYRRLKWWAMLFVMMIVQAPARDRRNWPAIRSWAAGLPAAFQLEVPKAAGPTQVEQ